VFLVSEMDFVVQDVKEGGGGWLALLMEDALWIDVSTAHARDVNQGAILKRVRERVPEASASLATRPVALADAPAQSSPGDSPPWAAFAAELREVREELAQLRRDVAGLGAVHAPR